MRQRLIPRGNERVLYGSSIIAYKVSSSRQLPFVCCLYRFYIDLVNHHEYWLESYVVFAQVLGLVCPIIARFVVE
jgi:hypothetical protein